MATSGHSLSRSFCDAVGLREAIGNTRPLAEDRLMPLIERNRRGPACFVLVSGLLHAALIGMAILIQTAGLRL